MSNNSLIGEVAKQTGYVIGAVHSSLKETDKIGKMQCPHCREYISPQAFVCPCCQRDISFEDRQRYRDEQENRIKAAKEAAEKAAEERANKIKEEQELKDRKNQAWQDSPFTAFWISLKDIFKNSRSRHEGFYIFIIIMCLILLIATVVMGIIMRAGMAAFVIIGLAFDLPFSILPICLIVGSNKYPWKK